MGPLAHPLCCSRYDGACKTLALHVGRADHCTDGSAAEQNRQRAEKKKAELNSGAVALAVCVWTAGHPEWKTIDHLVLTPSLWTSWWVILMPCLETGAQGNCVIYLMSQKMPVAKSGSESISPDLRLIVSPNFSFDFSEFGFSHASFHIMGQMLYRYNHPNLVYGWLAVLAIWSGSGYRSLVIIFLLPQFICFCTCSHREEMKCLEVQGYTAKS